MNKAIGLAAACLAVVAVVWGCMVSDSGGAGPASTRPATRPTSGSAPASSPATSQAVELTEEQARVLAARLVNEYLAGKEFKDARGKVLNPTWTKERWNVVEKKDGRWELMQNPPDGWEAFVSFKLDGSDANVRVNLALE